MRSKPSPLFVWKLILITILAGGAFMYFSDPMKIIFARRDTRIVKKLSQNQFKKDEIGIIFYGDSLMKAVLPYREETLSNALRQQFVKQGNKSKISVIKITTGGIWNLQEMSDQLIGARPSIIVIQSEMVVRRVFKNQRAPAFTEKVGRWSGVLGQKVFGQSQQAEKKETPKQFFTVEKKKQKIKRNPGKNKERLEVARHMWSNQAVSTTDSVFMMARRFIDRASAAGIRVVIVELPVSKTSASFSSKEYFAKRTEAIQSLSKSGALNIVYPHILPDRYFVDYNHVNPRGRSEFLNWFYPAFSEKLVKLERRF